MKFKFNTSDFESALDVVSIVTPRQATPSGESGYLFLVRGPRCYLYSRDSMCVARADFPIEDVEGEGAFVYPTDKAASLEVAFVGDTCRWDVSEEEGTFKVGYVGSNKAWDERMSFDPKLLSICDQDLEKASDTSEFPVGILREAINLGRPFLAQAKEGRVEEQYKGLQVFDKNKPEGIKGDGYLYASNATQTFYFQCDAFMDKHLEIHGLHLPALVTFLSKSEGNITVRRGDNFIFAVNSKGHVFGWPRQAKTHGKFSYYGLKNDQYILTVPKSIIQNALKHTRTLLDSKRDKIKVFFDAKNKELTLGAADGSSKSSSLPIAVTVVQSEDKDITWNVNIDHLLSLVDGVKNHEVQLRVAMVKSGEKEVAMFRTIDDFRMTPEGKVVIETEGTVQCKVTRFMPSKD